MIVTVDSYDLWRLEVPLGRVIGDCSCQYESLNVVAICLKTNQGHLGWGYGDCAWKGRFNRPAWYIHPMASLPVLNAEIDRKWWSKLKGRNAVEAWRAQRYDHSRYPYLDSAIRMALWDLMAQAAELPLFRYLGGSAAKNRIKAYGSLLDYPLTDDQAVGLAKHFLNRGFQSIKVKVGDPDVARDIRRLRAVRSAVGREVELTADANMAWNCDEAISRLRAFQQEGIALAYIEDPLSLDDTAGFSRLRQETDVAVVGHDYVWEQSQVRALLATRGLDLLRNSNHIDFGLASADLSSEFGVPMSFGNSMFEFNVHMAVALPNVDRLEFSDLAWNRLMCMPVMFEDGFGIAPERPGHGLAPDTELLTEFSCPDEDGTVDLGTNSHN